MNQKTKLPFEAVLLQTPAPFAVLRGPNFVFEIANQTYIDIVDAKKDIVGLPIQEALPEIQEEILDILKGVFNTGKSYSAVEFPIQLNWGQAKLSTKYFNFIYEPFRNVSNEVEGIIAFGYEVTAQVQARNLIENERENFRNLFRQTPEMVCILDGPEHIFEFVNEAHIKALGFDATGMKVRDAQPESVEVYDILDRVYQTGESAELHEIPVTVTNRLRYFNLTYSARRNTEGEINGIMILGTEVTEQVLNRRTVNGQKLALEVALADAPIKESLEELVTTVENQIGGDAIASILLANPDRTLSPIAGKKLDDEYCKALENLQAGPEVGSCGTAAFTKKTVISHDIDNDPKWKSFLHLTSPRGLKACWSIPILSSDRTVLGVFGIYHPQVKKPIERDLQFADLAVRTAALIIERHHQLQKKIEIQEALQSSEARLRKSEEYLSSAIEVSKVGFYDWDIQQNKLTLSKQFYKDWGIDPATFDHNLQSALELIHPDDREKTSQLIQAAMEKKIPYETSYRIVRPDKKVLWLDVKGRVIYSESGQPIRFFGTTINITELKQMHEEIELAKLQAERASAVKSAFLANMSHEIRTPLGAILGFLEIIKSEAALGETNNSYLTVIERNSQQLLQIVNDILDLSKVEAGKMHIEKVQFQLAELLSDIASIMTLKSNEKAIGFSIIAKNAVPTQVISDPLRIRQVLINLIGNAIKFTDVGSVKLEVEFRQSALIFRVSDTGPGIPSEKSDLLFKPFNQLDASTTRKFGGSGLGLSLVKHITQLLGGDVSLKESQLNVGSVFEAIIPVQVVPQSQTLQGQVLEKPIPSSLREKRSKTLDGISVLLAEDSQDNQMLFRTLLEGMGAKVTLASNGREGVAKALSEEFDIVLMDIQMPEMDGHTATKMLRESGYLKPIVALTAHAMKEELERTKASGFTDFISKPVEVGRLSALISHHSRFPASFQV